MNKEKATQLMGAIEEIRGIKKDLMGWQTKDGWTPDAMVEAYLKGILNAE